MPRFHCKHGKDGTGSISIPRISGFHGTYYQYGTEPSRSKNKKIRVEPRQILEVKLVTARTLSRLPGKKNATNQVIPPAPLFYRSLQMDLTMAHEIHLNLSPDSREELIWWDTQMIKWNDRTVLATKPDLTIESDASSQGWGESCQGTSTGRPWSPLEKKWYINCLELLAASLALKTFVKNTKGLSVLSKIDNRLLPKQDMATESVPIMPKLAVWSISGKDLMNKDLILNSWRTKTNKSYDSLVGQWNRWCTERGSDPFSGPVSEVANFLATLYQEGYQYNSVNAYRLAISSVHEKVDGVPVGQHPIITRLVKGVFNMRPPIPRYSNPWLPRFRGETNIRITKGSDFENSLSVSYYKTV